MCAHKSAFECRKQNDCSEIYSFSLEFRLTNTLVNRQVYLYMYIWEECNGIVCFVRWWSVFIDHMVNIRQPIMKTFCVENGQINWNELNDYFYYCENLFVWSHLKREFSFVFPLSLSLIIPNRLDLNILQNTPRRNVFSLNSVMRNMYSLLAFIEAFRRRTRVEYDSICTEDYYAVNFGLQFDTWFNENKKSSVLSFVPSFLKAA